MSLETLHTDARRAALLLKRAPARIAARVCGVDLGLALHMHEWLTTPQDGPRELPSTFNNGAAAACFALIKISVVKPAVFWGALFAIPSLPVLIALRWI